MKPFAFKYSGSKGKFLLYLLMTATNPALAFGAMPATFALNLSLICPSGRPPWMASTVSPPIDDAVIFSIPSKMPAQQSLSDAELTRGEMIAPAHANHQRVVLQWKVGPHTFAQGGASVPQGMVVDVGEEVAFTPFHGDPDNLFLFIPNLIMP